MQLSLISLALTKVYGGVAAFSPSSLFASGEQGAWYDPSDLTTMFQDSAGTTPVTAVGQPVGKILDKSGNGNNASQSTAGNRPIAFYYDCLDDGLIFDVSTANLNVTLGAGSYYIYNCYPNASWRNLVTTGPFSHAGGTFTLPTSDTVQVIIIDRELTTEEKSSVFNYYMATPVITSPADFSIVTVSTLKTIVTDNPASVITADGVPITSSWTPSSVDYSVSLAADGGKPNTVVVAEANAIVNFGSWSLSNCTRSSGISDPFGGTGAYRLTLNNSSGASVQHYLSASVSPSGSVANAGFELWIKSSASVSSVMIYALDGGATHYAYVNVATGETSGNFSRCYIMERIGDWSRVWFSVTQDTTCNSIYMYLTNSLTANSMISAGTETIDLYMPRSAKGSLPMLDSMLWRRYKTGITSGVDKWEMKSPFQRNEANNNQPLVSSILVPDSYNSANKYPVVYVGMVEYTPISYGDPIAYIQSLGLHNTYNCIFATCTFDSSVSPWYGKKSDGTSNHDAHFYDGLVELVDSMYSTIRSREGRMLLGFSKSGWGSLSALLRRSGHNGFGYAAAWDMKWGMAYGEFETATEFASQAAFDEFDPAVITSSNKAAISDKTRFVLAGYYSFQTQLASEQAYLTSLGIPHSYISVAASGHSWNAGWLSSVVGELMTLTGRF